MVGREERGEEGRMVGRGEGGRRGGWWAEKGGGEEGRMVGREERGGRRGREERGEEGRMVGREEGGEERAEGRSEDWWLNVRAYSEHRVC